MRPSWVRPDVTDTEIADSLRDLPFKARVAVKMLEREVEEAVGTIRRHHASLDEAEVLDRAQATVRRDIAEALAERDEEDPVIIILRNERLLEALAREAARLDEGAGPVAICYGVGHGTHLVRALESAGYVVERVAWHDVFSVASD